MIGWGINLYNSIPKFEWYIAEFIFTYSRLVKQNLELQSKSVSKTILFLTICKKKSQLKLNKILIGKTNYLKKLFIFQAPVDVCPEPKLSCPPASWHFPYSFSFPPRGWNCEQHGAFSFPPSPPPSWSELWKQGPRPATIRLTLELYHWKAHSKYIPRNFFLNFLNFLMKLKIP